MVGETRLVTELARAVKRVRADGVSACAHAASRCVLRFAHGAIHQDLTQETIDVTLKVLRGGRAGVASVGTLQPADLRACARAAADIARHAPPPSHLPPLPANHRLSTTEDYVRGTARADAAACVRTLERLFRLCRGAGAELAGSLVFGEEAWAVVNTAGTVCYAASTVCGARLVTFYRALSGYASGAGRSLARLDLDELLARSLRQSLHRAEPVALPLGVYEVVLEPEAVAELVEWMGYTGFGAKSVEERTSFLAGRMGERLLHPSVTIVDDGTDAATLRLPFDAEGTPRQRVVLIDRGKAAGLVYDTTYGARFNHASTGHALGANETEGPLPQHLALAPGRARAAELIRTCERGLWIPRFHYVNGLLNPRQALMTGLTREGCFLIRDGKLAAPVKTLRFTQSMLDAFRHVRGISVERRLIAAPALEGSAQVMPAVRLATFAFTGSSES
jgi:predicted Zn-dependent protease